MGMVLVMRRVDDAQLSMLRADLASVPEFALGDEAAPDVGDMIDFDKAWHALHFILTGTGSEVDAPLSFLRKDHEALSKLSDEDLHARYDPAALGEADVYLGDLSPRKAKRCGTISRKVCPP